MHKIDDSPKRSIREFWLAVKIFFEPEYVDELQYLNTGATLNI
jgi:hypothetical protein